MSLREVTPLTVPLALIAHQVFCRRETYRIAAHFSLLFGPPILVTSHVSSSRPHSVGALFATFLNALTVYLATLAASTVAYRLSPFHPLARYPSPLWCRVSMIGPAVMVATGNCHRAFANMHKEHGDIVQTGPNELSVANALFVEPLLDMSGLPKGPMYVGGSMSDANLNLSALEEYEPSVIERVQLLVHRLKEQSGTLDLGLWFKYFGYDFMSDMAFGGGSELLKDGDKNNIWSIIEEGLIVTTVIQTLPWLGIYLGKIPIVTGPMVIMHNNARRLAKERLERGSKRQDLYHYLCNEDLPDKTPPTLEELANNGILAVVAGSDTASITMTSLFYCLLTHPKAYARLQEEIDQYYPAGKSASESKHHREMHYLPATINKVLRLFPPLPLCMQRQVRQNAEPVVIGSVVIPPGTSVFLPPWVLHRDLRNFTFPLEYWPERWLITLSQARYEDVLLPSSVNKVDRPELVHNEAGFMPFSIGPMNCPGKGLAMMEMWMVVVALMQSFTFKLRDGWDPTTFEEGYKDYITAARPELSVIVERRDRV